MRRAKRIAATALLLATAANHAGLAQTDASHKWTLQECVDYALANNIEVKSGSLQIEQADAQADGATGQLLPSLSFSTSHNLGWRPWSQSTVALSGGTMTTTQSDATYSGNYALQANWTVWDGGRTRRERDSYRLDVEKAKASKTATALSIEEQVLQYYVQILYEADAAKVADSTLATSQALLKRGEEMMEAGQMAKVEVAQLAAQAAQDRYSLVSTQTQLANTKTGLKQILEIIKTTDFDVATPDIPDEDVTRPLPTVDDAFATAMETRPEVRDAILSSEQAEIQERIARSGHYPTISLSAGVQTGHNSADHDDVGEQIKQNVNNTVGLNINVPIIDNRQTRTNKAKAQIQRRQSELDKQNAENSVYKQVETYLLNAQSAQAQYIAAKANEESAKQSFDLVKEQFTLGLKNIAELMQGKSNLLTAQQQTLQSKYTAVLNAALLNLYTSGEAAL